MKNCSAVLGISILLICVFALLACSTAESPSGTSPVGFQRTSVDENAPQVGPIDPVVVNAADAAALVHVENGRQGGPGRRIESPLSDEEVERLQNEALLAPANELIQTAPDVAPLTPMPGTVFESLDFASAGGNYVPPDPEFAVGPNHTITVVNDYLYITDTVGTPLLPPIQFANLFTGVTGCTTGLFDPNTLYDEQLDRFVVAIDGNGAAYCVAMSQTSDPTLGWTAYGFATVPSSSGDFFDYPHAGVGQDAIYMGANIFPSAGGFRAEVWAIDKHAMAAGSPLPTPVQQTLPSGDTPQPMNAHGWIQGTWPVGAPHTVLVGVGNGDGVNVWNWTDPFGANVFVQSGTVNLATASGVSAGFPIDAPQLGGSNVQANDWRVLDCEYRNGDVWMTQNISCNPGSGVVDCLRWAEIDPVTPAVLQAGVFASDGEYMIFPDAGVNHCDDMTVGYTKTSAVLWPEVWFAGRLGIDPPGLLQPETPLRPGDQVYATWESSPLRWGDYTGGTSDPDGVRTWYLGEYSKTLPGTPLANWGTFVGEFSTDCAVDLAVAMTDGVSEVAPGDSVTYTITVTNMGRGDAFGAVVIDTFPADLTGVTWTCVGQAGLPAAVCSVPAGTGDINLPVDIEMGAAITITATGTLSTSATGTLVNTAAANYAGMLDPAPGDNSATDTNTILPAADLAVTKTDGLATAVPGTGTSYTVVVSNAGPIGVVGAGVTDTLPAALTDVTWTCTGSGGATCTAAGTGNIADSVDLPVGGSATYSVSAEIDPSATGSLSNTATVAAPAGVTDPVPGNNSSTDDTNLDPQADLGVYVTDGSCYVLPGDSLSYTVTVGNNGPSDSPSASVSDTVPVELTVSSWTCSASGGAACGAASGAGPLSDSPNLPVGAGVTYTVDATVSVAASGVLIYEVTASPGAGVTDPDPTNDRHFDVNALELPIFCDEFESGDTTAWSSTSP